MNRNSWIPVLLTFPLVLSCQSEKNAAPSDTRRVATRPASLSTAGLNQVRVSVPSLGDAGVATDVRSALLALPKVTQVLPNFSSKEIVIRASEAISSVEVMQVLASLGLQGRVL